jgi:epoxyqueuosine reductase
MHIPLAIDAGLGELGKHGSMICREYGSNFRLSAVGTDLPLAADQATDIGVDDLCASCRVLYARLPARCDQRREGARAWREKVVR